MTERKFEIKHTFKYLKNMDEYDFEGDKEKHFNLDWSINLSQNNDDYFIGLSCNDENADYSQWLIDVEFELRLIGKDEEWLKMIGKHRFDRNSEDSDSKLMTMKMEQMEKYLIDGNLTVEFHVKILKTEGVKGMKSKFEGESMKKHSDVVLVVDGEKFYVSKAYLASRSTYFESLLTENSNESNQSEVVLQGIEVDRFQTFLEVLYAETAITDKNLKVVLDMAVMYDTKCIFKQAEQFLMTDTRKSRPEIAVLASKYTLESVKKYVIARHCWSCRIQNLLPDDLTQLDHPFLAEIFQKYISFTRSKVLRIFVKTLTGKQLKVDIECDAPTALIKELIEETEGIPVDEQRLIYAGKQFNDDRTLNDYNVHDYAVIHMVLRLRGGQCK